MTRPIWITASTLVAGRAVADVVGTCDCGELSADRVAAIIFLGLLFSAAIVAVIRKGT
jgi:hypothetical protein